MNRRKFIRLAILFIVVGTLIISASTGCLGYLVQACRGQLSIMCKRRPVDEALADPALQPSYREKLRHLQKVRAFARDTLRLTPGDSYTLYADIEREAVAWNVTAARPLALEAKTWWFPIVGTVPYLGYFSEAEALATARDLEAEGFETQVRPVAAYSTLGWFDDPILSSQLLLPEYYLTDLIIHESAHATIWFPGDVDFNESFASFVGREGALHFYREREGAESRIYRDRLQELSERRALTDILRNHAQRLDALYKSPRSDQEKLREKKQIIAEMLASMAEFGKQARLINIEGYLNRKYNNAVFLSYLRYSGGVEFFQNSFRENGEDWGRFLDVMRKLSELSPEERKRRMGNFH